MVFPGKRFMKSPWSIKGRESRSKRRIEAFVHRQNGRELRVLVTNISRSGCGLRPSNELAADELVRIEIPRVGSFAAEIRWTSAEFAGARFIPQSDVWEEAARTGICPPASSFDRRVPGAAQACEPGVRATDFQGESIHRDEQSKEAR